MSTRWGVYPLKGKDASGMTVDSSDRSAVKWFVRWRVDGGAPRKRTFNRRGHAETFHKKLVAAQVQDARADERGWPVLDGPAFVTRTPGHAPTAPSPGLTFEEYCNTIWYPNNRHVFGDKNRIGHRSNMKDAIEWLRYQPGDHRLETSYGVVAGGSILLSDLVSDDTKRAVAIRKTTNKRTASKNGRTIDAAFASGATDVSLAPESASPATVRAFYITLAMILNDAKDSQRLEGEPLRGTSRSAPKPKTTTLSSRIVPSVDEVFELADAIARLGPIMPDGHPAGEMFRTLVLCGGTLAPRPGELTAHQPSWIDWDDPVVMRFHQTKAPIYDREEGIRGHQTHPLKHREHGDFRPVPVLADVADALRDHIERGYAEPDQTWHGLKGAPITWGNLMNVYWRPACAKVFAGTSKAALVEMTPSLLRKSAITFWLDSGISPYQAAEWAGHSEDVSKRYYAGRSSTTFQREAAVLASNYQGSLIADRGA